MPRYLILFCFLPFLFFTCLGHNQTDIPKPREEKLATFYSPRSPELKKILEKGYIDYVFLRFKKPLRSYIFVPKLKQPRNYFYATASPVVYKIPFKMMYYAGDSTILTRVESKFNPAKKSYIKEVGIINPQIKRNQNLEYIEQLLNQKRESVHVVVHFYIGVTANEVDEVLSKLNIPYKQIPYFSQHVVCAEINHMDQIDSILEENTVYKINYSRYLDENAHLIGTSKLEGLYQCEGSSTPYGFLLSYMHRINDN